jgi:hypothetical protein
MDSELLNAIRHELTVIHASVPGLYRRRADKAYEVFILARAARALRRIGAHLEARDRNGTPTSRLVIRLAPGAIYSPASAPGYVFVNYEGRQYEIQNGILVSGASGIEHELDVCVLPHRHADECRLRSKHPLSRQTLMLAECKFYRPNPTNTNLPLGFGNNILGLCLEFRSSLIALCANQRKPAIHQMLSHHTPLHRDRCRAFFPLIPSRRDKVNQFTCWLQTELEHLL